MNTGKQTTVDAPRNSRVQFLLYTFSGYATYDYLHLYLLLLTFNTPDAHHDERIGRKFLGAGLADELHVVVAPFFVGDPLAPRVVADGRSPWNPDRPARLAEVRQLDDVVLLRYALSPRFEVEESPLGAGGVAEVTG